MGSPNAQPDIRLNWTAIVELARPVALADPAAPVTCATLGHSKGPVDPLHPQNPQPRLCYLLDIWAGMHEAAWSEVNVKALFDDIMDIFREYPEAERWFREWRAAHPEARLT